MKITIEYNGATVVLDYSADVKCLEHDLFNDADPAERRRLTSIGASGQGVIGWVTAAIIGKISQCRKRAVREALAVKSAAMSAVPVNASDAAIAAAWFAAPEYKSRSARESKR